MLVIPAFIRRIDPRDERGVTMLLALFVLVITTGLLAASYIAVLNDTGPVRTDLDQKRALSAAEAGIAQYSYDLNQNPNFWETCTAANNVPVGPADNGSTETYAFNPVPATGYSACDSNNPIATMIEGAGGASGTFRISATGCSAPTGTLCSATNGVQRTIVAQYKRTSFLNFVYYTDYETLDPSAVPGQPTDCAFHWPNRGLDCGAPIDFVGNEAINGPMHTEDTAAICGSGNYAAGQAPASAGTVFGRTSADSIEAAGFDTEIGSGLNSNGCRLSYDLVGTVNTSAPSLLPPPSNAQLLNVAQSGGDVYTGTTTIVLNGGTMNVTTGGVTTNGVALPTNGVIYVQSDPATPCAESYTPYTANATYSTAANQVSCGNIYVSGTYNKSLTIASDNDIIISGNLSPTGTTLGNAPSGTTLLGLVANNFVRVEHGVSASRGSTSGSCNGASNVGSQSFSNLYVYAAILSVAHSFVVDNFDCGSSLGTLTIWGTLAQLFRGPVGTSGSGGTGYIKNYNYNDVLASAEPPYFLNPVSVAWYVQRQTECDVTASC
jgi:Tfp pilus assembly protein PilX